MQSLVLEIKRNKAMKSKNTGKYRLCRRQKGIGCTRTVLSEHKSEDECTVAYNTTLKEIGWENYCEQEIIYIGSHKD